MSAMKVIEDLHEEGIMIGLVGKSLEISGGPSESQQMAVAANRDGIVTLIKIYNRGYSHGANSAGACMSQRMAADHMRQLSAEYQGDERKAYESGYLIGQDDGLSTMTTQEAVITCRHGSCKGWCDKVRSHKEEGRSETQSVVGAVGEMCRACCPRDSI